MLSGKCVPELEVTVVLPVAAGLQDCLPHALLAMMAASTCSCRDAAAVTAGVGRQG